MCAPGRRPRWRARLLVSGCLAVALVWLLFGGLREKGTSYYDEACNVLEARFLAEGILRAAGYAAARVSGESIGFRAYVHEKGRPDGYYPSYGKPAHTVILAAGLVATGGEVWGAWFAMAVMALVGLWAQWRWGAAMVGEGAGRWGALTLAGSAFFVIYARETLAEADSVALFTLGLLLLARMRVRPPRRPRLALVAAGLLFGLAFAANYRWFWIPAILVGESLFFSPPPAARPGNASRGIALSTRLAWVSVGFVLPLILAEIPGLLLRWYFRRQGLPPPFETYFQQLSRLYFYHPTSLKGVHFGALPTYAYLLLKWTSPVLVAMTLLGIVRLVSSRRHRRLGWFLTVPPLVMLGFYSIYVYNFARFAALSLPFLALLAGAGISSTAVWIAMRWGPRRLGATRLRCALGVLVVLVGLPATLDARAVRSPYPAVGEWLEANGDGLVASTELHGMRLVYGTQRVIPIPPELHDISRLRSQGVRWVVIGALRRYWGDIPAVVTLTRRHRPTRCWRDLSVDHPQYAFEHNVRFEEAIRGTLFEGLNWVEAYDLSTLEAGGVPGSRVSGDSVFDRPGNSK